jgi:gamma-D-glutamyl-L-lysine dipeptidyl-peptidase
MKEFCIVNTLVANLYKEPSFKSELVTQALIKEKLFIIEKKDNWYKVKQWDNYISWIHKFYTIKFDSNLSIAWNEVKVNKKSINELITFSKSFIGVPYLWGGKSSLGFDCSGFVQSVFKISGINMPRDASQQILKEDLLEIDYCKIQKGDLLFFSENNHVNHVAIYIGGNKIIHSSGSVKIEILKENKELNRKLYKIMSIKSLFND